MSARQRKTTSRNSSAGVQKEAQNLTDLTGWDLEMTIKKAGLNPSAKPSPWWHGLWD